MSVNLRAPVASQLAGVHADAVLMLDALGWRGIGARTGSDVRLVHHGLDEPEHMSIEWLAES